MSVNGKKGLAVFLVFCLVAFSGNLSAQGVKKGVKITIEKNNGDLEEGELISVKRDSLLILDAETQADLSLPLRDVNNIKVHNKSRMVELGILGALGGAAVQGIVAKTEKKVEKETQEGLQKTEHGMPSFLLYGVIVGAAGVALGAVIGIDKTIQVQGKSEAELLPDLEKLAKKARVKGIQL